MTMDYGYSGRIGFVELNSRAIEVIHTDGEMIQNFLGGRGFIAKYLYDYLPPDIDPLGEENILILAVGPLTGTLAPTSGRVAMGSKAPLTGLNGTGNAGRGQFRHAL